MSAHHRTGDGRRTRLLRSRHMLAHTKLDSHFVDAEAVDLVGADFLFVTALNGDISNALYIDDLLPDRSTFIEIITRFRSVLRLPVGAIEMIGSRRRQD